nr:hypothetical protein [uncultured Arsenicibacter sp.]
MKISINNYKTLTEGLDETQLPEALQSGHDVIKFGTRNFKSWSRYESDAAFREVVDLQFAEMEKYLGAGSKKKANTAKIGTLRRASSVKKTASASRKASVQAKAKKATEKAKARKEKEVKPVKAKKTAAKKTSTPKAAGTRTVRTTLGRAVLDALRGDAPKAPKKGKRSFQNSVATKRKANERRIKRTLGDRKLVPVSAGKADLKGKQFIRQVDKLADQIHEKSRTDKTVTYPVYRISRSEAKRQAFRTLKNVKSGKVKNVKLKV